MSKQIGCEKGSGRATTSKNWRTRCVLTQPNELSPLGLKNGKIKTSCDYPTSNTPDDGLMHFSDRRWGLGNSARKEGTCGGKSNAQVTERLVLRSQKQFDCMERANYKIIIISSSLTNCKSMDAINKHMKWKLQMKISALIR